MTLIFTKQTIKCYLIFCLLIIYIIIIYVYIRKYILLKNNLNTIKRYDNKDKKIKNFELFTYVNADKDNEMIPCNTLSDCNINNIKYESCIKIDTLTNIYVYDRINPIPYYNKEFKGFCGTLKKKRKDLKCSFEKGGRYHLYKHKNLKFTYSWFCKCLHPWIFDKPYEFDLISDCSYYKGCSNREYVINDKKDSINASLTDYYNSISCKCLDHEYQIKIRDVNQCRSGNYFQITTSNNDYNNISEYNLNIDQIDKSWIEMNFGSEENFKRLRPLGIPNPCLYDAITNEKIDKIHIQSQQVGIDVSDNGIYYCYSLNSRFVTVQFTSDYLANNDGKYPNGIVEISKKESPYCVIEDSTYDVINSILSQPLNGWRILNNNIPKQLFSLIEENLIEYSKYPHEDTKKINCLLFYNAPNAMMTPIYNIITNPMNFKYFNITSHHWKYYNFYRTLGFHDISLLNINNAINGKYKISDIYNVAYATHSPHYANFKPDCFKSIFDTITSVAKSNTFTTTDLYFNQFYDLKKYPLFNYFLFVYDPDSKTIIYNPKNDLYTGTFEINLNTKKMYPFYIGNHSIRQIFKNHVINCVFPAKGLTPLLLPQTPSSTSNGNNDIIWMFGNIVELKSENSITEKKDTGNISNTTDNCEDLNMVDEKSILSYFSNKDSSECSKFINGIPIAVVSIQQ
ncbi:MAG: per os infectivity factor pif-1 [Cotesia congregata filamentous virus 2]